MANEPIQGGPYPVPTDPPDGPSQIKGVTDWAATRLNMRFASTAARDAAIPTPVAAMECAIGSGTSQVKYIHDGAAWRTMYEDTRWIAVPAAPGFSSACQVRRKSGTVMVRGSFSPASAGTITSTYVVMGTVPDLFRPDVAWPLSAIANVGAAMQANLAVNGQISFRTHSGSTSTTISTAFSVSGTSWTTD